jgi:hypothetical protein
VITEHNRLVSQRTKAEEKVALEKTELKAARKAYRKNKSDQRKTDIALEDAKLTNDDQEKISTLENQSRGLAADVQKSEDAITGDKQAKDQLQDARTARREARKQERKHQDEYEEALGVDDIKNKHEGTYGGNYGGQDVATSVAISQASNQVSTTTDAVSGQKVQMAAQDREAALRQQGVANTNMEQVNQARRETADDAKKSLTTGAILDMALGAFQAFRAEEHFRSMGDVNKTATTANKELESSYQAKVNAIHAKGSSPTQAKELEDAKIAYETQLGNVTKNKSEENKSQTNAGVAQSVAAAGMVFQGVQKLQQAAAINAIEAQMAGNAQQYGFAMGGGITQGGGQDGVNALSPVQSAVTTEEEGKKDDLAQNSNINPNDPNLVPEGPPAGAFIESKDQGGGGGGGAGPGMAGGTSADKSAMEAGAQGPAAVTKAGSYAPAAGGAGYKSRNAGGAGKAGVDTGFADLLKKFLPGAEPEKKKGPGELQFGDRSPASNQTAVIGRNKNIFEEISKRYQKKSAEGSVF